MILRLLHRTTFIYAGQARDSFNEARLCPVDDPTQSRRHFVLRTDPVVTTRDYRDFYGNIVHYFDVTAPHHQLVIEAESEIETTPNDVRAPIPAVPVSELATCAERELYAEFLNESFYVPQAVELWREAQDAMAGQRFTVWADAIRLGRHVYQTFAYKPRTTGVSTRATDALAQRTGVCQDFAHVMLGMCRSIGIPARYVSGYFFNRGRQPDDIEASHAWVEVMIPGHGWAGFDPTHDRAADERYVKVATGRDYADIRPVSGTYRGAPTRELRVEVAVTRSDPMSAPA
ncbi:MAG TPA: transglutaminase family protein [Opitutaceae bacterium]|nr:transglutaminase family protein [Opitutaceae bacterium]